MQQISDGLTKVSARQRLVEIIRRGYHALKYDPTFTAGKKLSDEDKRAREEELDAAAGIPDSQTEAYVSYVVKIDLAPRSCVRVNTVLMGTCAAIVQRLSEKGE